MRPLTLVLVLLFSGTLQAQSLADAARQERQRQAAYKNVPVYTNADVHQSAPPEKPTTEAPAKSAVPAAKPAPASPAVPAVAAVDPVVKWNEDLAKLKAIVTELQDRETADILKVNQWTNQYFAPVTDPQTQSEAQVQLAQAQSELAETRKELQTARQTLQAMEVQGPPTKP